MRRRILTNPPACHPPQHERRNSQCHRKGSTPTVIAREPKSRPKTAPTCSPSVRGRTARVRGLIDDLAAEVTPPAAGRPLRRTHGGRHQSRRTPTARRARGRDRAPVRAAVRAAALCPSSKPTPTLGSDTMTDQLQELRDRIRESQAEALSRWRPLGGSRTASARRTRPSRPT